MNAVKIPGQYAKFITSVVGLFLVYIQVYGWVWEPKAAATMAVAALGVGAVPNKPKPPAVALPTVPPSGNVTTIPPA